MSSTPAANETHPPPVAAEEARSEIEEYLEVRHEHQRLFPRAALVGVGAGSVAVLFRVLLAGGDNLRNALIDWSHQAPFFGWIFPVAVSAAGAGIAVLLVRRYAPETS